MGTNPANATPNPNPANPDEWRIKSFDLAADATKQLITVATGIITVTVLFSKDLTSVARGWALASWIILTLSVGFGLTMLLNLTGSANSSANPSLNDRGIRFLAGAQYIIFGLGIICVFIFGCNAIHVPTTTEKTPEKPVVVNCPAATPQPVTVSCKCCPEKPTPPKPPQKPDYSHEK